MYDRPQVFFPPEPASMTSPDTPSFALGPLLRIVPPSAQEPQSRDSDSESDAPTEIVTDVGEEVTSSRLTIFLSRPNASNCAIIESECSAEEEGNVLPPLSEIPETPGDRKLARLPSTVQRKPRIKRDAKRRFSGQETPSPSPPVGKKKKILTKKPPIWCTSTALLPCEIGLMRTSVSDASDLPTLSPSGGKRGRGYEADDESEKPKKRLKAEESDNSS